MQQVALNLSQVVISVRIGYRIVFFLIFGFPNRKFLPTHPIIIQPTPIGPLCSVEYLLTRNNICIKCTIDLKFSKKPKNNLFWTQKYSLSRFLYCVRNYISSWHPWEQHLKAITLEINNQLVLDTILAVLRPFFQKLEKFDLHALDMIRTDARPHEHRDFLIIHYNFLVLGVPLDKLSEMPLGPFERI